MTKAQEKRNPFALQTKAVHHDEWPDGFTVTVKALSYGEKQALDGLLVADVELSGDQLGDANAALSAMTLTPAAMTNVSNKTLLACIESWTFTLPDGSAAPLDEDTLLRLPRHYIAFIETAIEELNPTEDADFPGDNGSDDASGKDSS